MPHDRKTARDYSWGQYYFRYYAPQMGRFTSKYPLGFDGGDEKKSHVPTLLRALHPDGLFLLQRLNAQGL